MRIQFCSSSRAAVHLRKRARERLRKALRHLEWLVARVSVGLDEIGDPARKVDKRCRVELAVNGADAIAISAAGRSWQDTFDAAIAPLRQRIVMRLRQATAGRISHANASA